eukprot:COSAG01_NODE_58713_length_304_cov_1.004878_1_plen_60_part_01
MSVRAQRQPSSSRADSGSSTEDDDSDGIAVDGASVAVILSQKNALTHLEPCSAAEELMSE